MKPQGKFSSSPALGKGECVRCGAPRSYSSKTGLCRPCMENPPDSGSPAPGPEFKRPLKPSKKPSLESKANLVVNKLIGLSENEDEVFDRDVPSDLDLPPGDLDPEGVDLDRAEDLDTPEERTEVQIATDILAALDAEDLEDAARLEQIRTLAQELLDLHGEGSEEDPDLDSGDDLGVPPDMSVDRDEAKTV